MNKITACPFCNAFSAFVTNNGANYWVECKECQAKGPWHHTESRAIGLWNNSNDTRALLIALHEGIRHKPVIANFLAEKLPSTWPMVCEEVEKLTA